MPVVSSVFLLRAVLELLVVAMITKEWHMIFHLNVVVRTLFIFCCLFGQFVAGEVQDICGDNNRIG
jgi:hypothetical protein